MPLSLSPRYDLVRFHLPKTFLPKDIEEKYTALLNKDAHTMTTAIDYLNESIQSVTMPGISELTSSQTQHGFNNINKSGNRINVEASHDITYLTVGNPLEKIEKEFKVTFRANNGLLNYFMLYETAFWYACREKDWDCENVMYIELLNEDGTVISRVKYFDVHFDGIEGLSFDYSKIDREANTFECTFKFNNIDFEYLINEDYK